MKTTYIKNTDTLG